MACLNWSSSDPAEVSAGQLDLTVFASLEVRSWAWGYVSCLWAGIATVDAASLLDRADVMEVMVASSYWDVVVVGAVVAAAAVVVIAVVVVAAAVAAPDVVDMPMDGPDSSVDIGDSHKFPGVVATVAGHRIVHVDHDSGTKQQKRGS